MGLLKRKRKHRKRKRKRVPFARKADTWGCPAYRASVETGIGRFCATGLDCGVNGILASSGILRKVLRAAVGSRFCWGIMSR